MHMWIGGICGHECSCLWSPEDHVISSEAEIASHCEPPDLDAANQTLQKQNVLLLITD